MRSEPAKRIVLVDDDDIVRTILGKILERAGHAVTYVDNAHAAIAAIEARIPDVIITDIYMPDADGFELMNWMRNSGNRIPLVAISGTLGALQDQLALAKKLGADATMKKPFSEDEVLQAIETAIAAHRAS